LNHKPSLTHVCFIQTRSHDSVKHFEDINGGKG